MRDIRSSLPFEVLPAEKWLITSIDTNFQDVDVTGQSLGKNFYMPIFTFKRSKIHLYTKPIGNKTYLRVELNRERPDVTLSGLHAYHVRARQKLLEVAGK
jgi:hypothetical protein